MQKRFVDLHIHTNASDGLYSPSEAVKIAHNFGFCAVAITDHDSVNSFSEAKETAENLGMEIISGVELSASYNNEDFHILGYMIDVESSVFLKSIEEFQKERWERGEKMVHKLNELGIDLSMETVKSFVKEGSVGRPHLADALLKEEFVHTYEEAFARFLGYHAPAYVPKKFLTPENAIELIHQAQGVAVLAHPGTTAHDAMIIDFSRWGLDGIEAYHSQHDYYQTQHYINLANKLGLLYSGGSDCHGKRREKHLIGTVKVPYSCLEKLRKYRERKFKPRG